MIIYFVLMQSINRMILRPFAFTLYKDISISLPVLIKA